MTDPLKPLRVNAVELLRQPGATSTLDLSIDASPLEAQHERLDGDVRVELTLQSTNDGITVTGTISTDWATVCRRCLTDISGRAVGDVDELYQIDQTDPDAYIIENGQLDLIALVRETVLLELDLERVCRDECAGLCAICGIDRNSDDCNCDTTVTDDRWSALEGFVPDQ